MANYDCAGCGNNLNYENKMNGNKGSYSGSGKDDYASGMPDVFMGKYLDAKREY